MVEWWAAFIALNGLIVLLLALNVSRLRITLRIPYGDGGDKDMNQAIRAHANAVEHGVWMALLLLAMALLRADINLMAGLVALYTVGRLLHVVGMLQRRFNARRGGALLMYLAQLIAVLVLFPLLFGAL
ncbi:MAG: MAPEG family protein [Oleiphilaceae bacterium]|nr:MAPEG family protein [Oleiphilaceae bacterium]